MAAPLPSLRTIAAFEAAARHCNFRKAGAEIGLTGAAIRHCVKGLEKRLGYQLFERSGRSVTLTSEGQAFAARARLILSLLGHAFEARPWFGYDRIVISALPSVARKILKPGLHILQAQLPNVFVELSCRSFEPSCCSDLSGLDGTADLDVGSGPLAPAGIERLHLADETLFPIASPRYHNGDLPRSLRELRSCMLIRHPCWDRWLDPFGRKFDEFRSVRLVGDDGLMIDAVADCGGIGLAGKHLVQAALRSGRVVRLFDREIPAGYSYWAQWDRGSARREVIEKVAASVKSLFVG